LFSFTAVAGGIKAYEGENKPVDLKSLIPSYLLTREQGNMYYGEQYSFSFYSTKGFNAYIQFVISNLGMKYGKAAIVTRIQMPDAQSIAIIRISPIMVRIGISRRISSSSVWGITRCRAIWTGCR